MPGCREKGNHEPSFHHARILLKCELPLSDFSAKHSKNGRPCPFRSERHRDGRIFPLKNPGSVLQRQRGRKAARKREVLRMQENTQRQIQRQAA